MMEVSRRGGKRALNEKQRKFVQLFFEAKIPVVECYVIAYHDGVRPAGITAQKLASKAYNISASVWCQKALADMRERRTADLVRLNNYDIEDARKDALEMKKRAEQVFTTIMDAMDEMRTNREITAVGLIRMAKPFKEAMEAMALAWDKVQMIFGHGQKDGKAINIGQQVVVQMVGATNKYAPPDDDTIFIDPNIDNEDGN